METLSVSRFKATCSSWPSYLDQKCVEIVGGDPVGFQGDKVTPSFLRENQFPGLSSSIILDSSEKN